jgi:hypothetical protein
LASARSACGRGCGERLEGEMASPRPVGSQLRCRRARNGVVSRRVNERRGCVVVMAITFICGGVCDWNDQMPPACPAAARPSVTLPTRSLSPCRHPVPLTKPGHPSAGLLRNCAPRPTSSAPIALGVALLVDIGALLYAVVH